jgi:hypothetical protein
LRNELQAPVGAQSVPFAGPSAPGQADTATHAVHSAPVDVIPQSTSLNNCIEWKIRVGQSFG